MHSDAMKTNNAKLRVTVPVTPEVQETFKRLSEASGVSVGKAMGDWLQDTMEAALAMAELMERAREQPKLAMREIHGYTLGLQDMTQELLETIGRASRTVTPPVSNTGGKLPQNTKKPRGRNAKNKD